MTIVLRLIHQSNFIFTVISKSPMTDVQFIYFLEFSSLTAILLYEFIILKQKIFFFSTFANNNENETIYNSHQ